MRNLICAAAMLWGGSALAGMEPVEVGDVRHSKAQLTVSASEGEKSYSPAELEQLGTWRITTITPWREAPAEFVGTRLVDILEQNGLADAPAIRVVAENDYAVTIRREAWIEHDLLVATRVDGRGHSRRARGPIQFVFDMTTAPETGAEAFQSNWVWMAARIEAAE